MALTAAISYFSDGDADEYWWDVNTPEDTGGSGATIVFSAQGTTFDPGRTFRKAEWDFNDSTSYADGVANPQTDEGIIVSHRFPNATSHTIDLTVTDDAGTTDTDQLTLVVTNFTFTGGTNTWYVSEAGNDGNTGASDGQAFRTIQAAIDAASSSPGTPHAILLKRGSSFDVGAALTSLGNIAPGIICDYGTSSDPMPVVNISADLSGKGAQPFRNLTAPSDLGPGYSLQVENIRFFCSGASPTVRLNKFFILHSGQVTFRGCVFNGGGIQTRRTPGLSVENCAFRNVSGIPIESDSDWVMVRNCVIKRQRTGDEDAIKLDGPKGGSASSALIADCTIEGEFASQTDGAGIFLRNRDWVVIEGSEISGYTEGVHLGGQTDVEDLEEPSDNVLIRRNKIHSNTDGVLVGNADTVKLKNNLIFENTYGVRVYAPAYHPNSDISTDLRLFTNTFTDNGSADLQVDALTVARHTVTLELRANVFQILDTASVTRTTIVVLTETFSNLTITAWNYNLYYVEGQSSTGISFSTDGTSRTYTYWQNTIGHDANGVYADPYLEDAQGDFEIANAGKSGCTDAGGAQAANAETHEDYDGTARTGTFDIGAHEGPVVGTGSFL